MGGKPGSYNDWSGVIRITNENDLGDGELGVTLMHEILECLNARFEYKLQHSIIQGLSENLYQVLRDNKLEFTPDD